MVINVLEVKINPVVINNILLFRLLLLKDKVGSLFIGCYPRVMTISSLNCRIMDYWQHQKHGHPQLTMLKISWARDQALLRHLQGNQLVIPAGIVRSVLQHQQGDISTNLYTQETTSSAVTFVTKAS